VMIDFHLYSLSHRIASEQDLVGEVRSQDLN